MTNKKLTKRQRAIRKRRIFLSLCAAVVVLTAAIIVLCVAAIRAAINDNPKAAEKETVSAGEKEVKKEPAFKIDETPSLVQINGQTLDANYTRLLLVNEKTPLPEDYAYGENTSKIASKYLSGSLDRFDTGALPYLLAMIESAKKDGVTLTVWSPYRSYNDQKMVFERDTNNLMKKGMTKADAENEVRKTVLYPGTSEHHTGLCLDINMANSSFESTPAYNWLIQNAQDYGFVMRYPSDKEDITSIDYESWHWRFVGINRAKEMNEKNMCLEEFCEYAKVDNKKELAKK